MGHLVVSCKCILLTNTCTCIRTCMQARDAAQSAREAAGASAGAAGEGAMRAGEGAAYTAGAAVGSTQVQ
jgi:hypothetical protein